MLDLPRTTYSGKRIPKQKFYENLSVTPILKRYFVDQIISIVWQNKISPSTMNIAPGPSVTELEVFEIRLNQPELNEAVLQLIDRHIPYHILFILSHDGKEQAWISYKETAQSGNNAFKVATYYHTEWMPSGSAHLQLEGLTTDAVYENIVRQIAGGVVQAEKNLSLQDAVERDAKIKNLKKQIETLHAKIRKEKQLNVQMKLNKELKLLKKALEEL